MKATDLLKAPLWLAGLAGSAKSFRKNPLIGNAALNERGLHRERVSLAWRMAERRRAALAPGVKPEHREAFDRDGFIVIPDYLPRDAFDRLVASLRTTPLPAREMRQGQAVTRMIPLGPSVLAGLPEVRRVVEDRSVSNAIRYAASTAGAPVWFVQTVIAEPDRGGLDPQTEVHADTFHPTAKMWFFLQDVGDDDGPFMYVPGSHRLTPGRLEWEYRTSLTAREDKRHHHAHGSFRVRPDELAAMGFPQPRRMTVKANTVVIADTFGFHARTPSPKPTLRMEVHAYLRQAPFWPYASRGLRSLPGIAERQLDFYLAWSDLQKRAFKANQVWKPVGNVTADSPAHL
jgi:hypothetical protein